MKNEEIAKVEKQIAFATLGMSNDEIYEHIRSYYPGKLNSWKLGEHDIPVEQRECTFAVVIREVRDLHKKYVYPGKGGGK